MIEIYPGSIDYGLIQFCHSTAQTIQLTNVSRRKVNFLMKQLVQVRNNGFMVSLFVWSQGLTFYSWAYNVVFTVCYII